MNWRALIGFAGWCAFCLFVFLIVLVFTQMGDCFDAAACQDYKHRTSNIIWIGGPLIWLAGALLLFRRWSR